MGCFDSVCSFSKLPVHTGNDVVVQYVYSGEGNDPHSEYSWGQFGFPIFGKYNDYGDIEDVDESHIGFEILKRSVDAVKPFVPIMERAHLEDDNAPLVDRFMANVVAREQILPHILSNGDTSHVLEESDWRKGRMKLKEDISANFVYKCFIHRKVYDRVVAIGETLCNDPEGYFGDDFTIVTPELLAEYVAKRVEQQKLIESDPVAAIKFDLSDRNVNRDDPLRWVDRFFDFAENDCYPHTEYRTKQVAKEMIRENITDINMDHPLFKALLEHKYFRMGRIALNLELVPHFTFSCQQYYDNSDLDRFAMFRDAVVEVSDDMRKRFEDDE